MQLLYKILIGILILLIFKSCHTPLNDEITEIEIYDFLNEVIPALTGGFTKCDAIRDGPILYISGEGIKSKEKIQAIKKTLALYAKSRWIKSKDIDYILSQQNDSTFRFQQNLLKKRVLTRQDLDNISGKPHSNGSFQLFYSLQKELDIYSFGRISKPFFSIDKKTAILVFEVYRNYENANGFILIYKKIDDKWIEFHKMETWIS